MPAAILVTVRLIPADVMVDLRREAEIRLAGQRPRSVVGAIVIVGVWLVGAAWIEAVLLSR